MKVFKQLSFISTRAYVFFSKLTETQILNDCIADFVDAYVHNAVLHNAPDASAGQTWSDGDNNDPSEDFVTNMDKLSNTLKWRSNNYRLISEYSNSMSLSDSSIEQLLLLVINILLCCASN